MNYDDLLNKSRDLYDFCQKGKFLSTPYRGSDIDSIVINDPILANSVCNMDTRPDYDFWQELCGEKFSELNFDTPHWLPKKIEIDFVQPLKAHSIHLNFIDVIPTIWDSVEQDFWYLLANAVAEQPIAIFNSMKNIYLSGGWPCGWKGIYPNGKIVVFSKV